MGTWEADLEAALTRQLSSDDPYMRAAAFQELELLRGTGPEARMCMPRERMVGDPYWDLRIPYLFDPQYEMPRPFQDERSFRLAMIRLGELYESGISSPLPPSALDQYQGILSVAARDAPDIRDEGRTVLRVFHGNRMPVLERGLAREQWKIYVDEMVAQAQSSDANEFPYWTALIDFYRERGDTLPDRPETIAPRLVPTANDFTQAWNAALIQDVRDLDRLMRAPHEVPFGLMVEGLWMLVSEPEDQADVMHRLDRAAIWNLGFDLADMRSTPRGTASQPRWGAGSAPRGFMDADGLGPMHSKWVGEPSMQPDARALGSPSAGTTDAPPPVEAIRRRSTRSNWTSAPDATGLPDADAERRTPDTGRTGLDTEGEGPSKAEPFQHTEAGPDGVQRQLSDEDIRLRLGAAERARMGRVGVASRSRRADVESTATVGVQVGRLSAEKLNVSVSLDALPDSYIGVYGRGFDDLGREPGLGTEEAHPLERPRPKPGTDPLADYHVILEWKGEGHNPRVNQGATPRRRALGSGQRQMSDYWVGRRLEELHRHDRDRVGELLIALKEGRLIGRTFVTVMDEAREPVWTLDGHVLDVSRTGDSSFHIEFPMERFGPRLPIDVEVANGVPMLLDAAGRPTGEIADVVPGESQLYRGGPFEPGYVQYDYDKVVASFAEALEKRKEAWVRPLYRKDLGAPAAERATQNRATDAEARGVAP